MAESLKSFEMSSVNGAPLVGLVVQLFAGSDIQPNPGAVLAATTTDSNGIWQFTGLADGTYDVKVTAPGINQIKWYKGNVKVGVAEIRGVVNNVAQVSQGRNRIINGRFQVNERLQVVVGGDNASVIDRWKIMTEAANAATFARDTATVPTGANYAGRLIAGTGNNNKFGLWQTLDSREIGDFKVLGASLSLQLRPDTANMSHIKVALIGSTNAPDSIVSTDPISSWNAAGTAPTLAAGFAYINTPVDLAAPLGVWTPYKIFEGLAVASNYNNLAVFIWSDTKTTVASGADVLRFTDIQLEPGPICTQIEQRPYPTELALCYAYHIEPGAQGNIYFATNAAGISQAYGISVGFPYPMRAVPSFYLSGAWAVNNCGQPALNSLSKYNALITWSSLAAGIMYSSSSATAYLVFDAEV